MINWLRSLSIRNKVIALSAIAFWFFIINFTVNSLMIFNVQSDLRTASEKELPVLAFINELQALSNDVDRGLQTAITEVDETTLRTALEKAARLSDRIVQIRQQNPEQANVFSSLYQKLDAYTKLAASHTQMALNGENMDTQTAAENFLRIENARIAYTQQQNQLIAEWFDKFNVNLATIKDKQLRIIFIGMAVGIVLMLMIILTAMLFIGAIRSDLNHAISASDEIANGNLHHDIQVQNQHETGQLMYSLRVMRDSLLQQMAERTQRDTEQRTLAGLNEVMRGDMAMNELADRVLTYLARSFDGAIGGLYLLKGDQLQRYSSYAQEMRKGTQNSFGLGEGVIGQCALEKKPFVLTDLPADYTKIATGAGYSVPTAILVVPILFNDELIGVIELGSFKHYSQQELNLLVTGCEGIGIAINSAQNRLRMEEMLHQTKEQASILAQQADTLQQQQQAMEQINLELEQRSLDLDSQKNEILKKNYELERSKKVLMEKSEALEASGRYKTQFLSTMSHELRTPLNSILILSQSLMDNRSSNLSSKEVEHASVIHSSGSDLLSLINDILDLSKVEEGKMELVIEQVSIPELANDLDRKFKYVAQNKHLEFKVEVEDGLPPQFATDVHRLNQVLKNFISNAIKFTDAGAVTIRFQRPAGHLLPVRSNLGKNDALVIAVTDSGLGIAKDKQDIIFEAFKQADGTTSRKYGGTGLGLTIARELAGLLGGEIMVHSDGLGHGSTFAVLLPLGGVKGQAAPQPAIIESTDFASEMPTTPNFTHHTQLIDKILIVEDDEKFAGILRDIITDANLECDVVHTGRDALMYLDIYQPQAIILDISLPDMKGWEVIKKVRGSSILKNTPVHVVSALPEQRQAQTLGARNFIEKPVSQSDVADLLNMIKEEISGSFNRLLIVEDNVELHDVISEQFNHRGMAARFVTTGEEALDALGKYNFDCLIVDLKLPDCDGLDLLQSIRNINSYSNTPVIVFTAEDLQPEREFEISKFADRVVIKSYNAMERLMEATHQFLRTVSGVTTETLSVPTPTPLPVGEPPAVAETPAAAATPISSSDYPPADLNLLKGCKVLLVDDDIRNIYSMSSVLESVDMDVVTAMSGQEALDALAEDDSIQLILMDIMMPEMDGYETTRRVRAQAKWADTPIITLTAKAMKEDRQLCLDAGATDYIAKPVDVELLKQAMSHWLATATA